MKQLVIVSMIATLSLTGCISTRGSINDGLNVQSVENQRVVEDKGSFSLLLPTGFEIELLDENTSGGRLSGVKEAEAESTESIMLIEETDISIDDIITELLATGVVRETARESLMIGEHEGVHLSAVFTETGKSTDYYFVRPQNRTYIFSLPADSVWGYFESVVLSFEHGQDTLGTGEIPEISLDDIEIN